ncbi:Polynucleotide 5'-hydroxyl-kinase grc3 [Myotisia sp. PD_48]|nr:Polynucleotide 5'-hydroxyl-kinase grc3 [Myotisia sp. PD_48]
MKRKATGQPLPGPISAIAARRAKQQQNTSIEKPSVVSAERQSDAEPSVKRSKTVSARSTARSSTISRTTREKHPSAESSQDEDSTAKGGHRNTNPVKNEPQPETEEDDRVEFEFSGTDENEDGSYESQAGVLEAYEDFALSKVPIRENDVLYCKKESVCIRLKLKSTLAVIGQYDLWVKRGVVSICGAKLDPNPRLYRVFAPSTHSLPVIKAVSGSEGYAEVELFSVFDGLCDLWRISPLYDQIWCAKQPANSTSSSSFCRPSFSILNVASDDPYKRHLRPLHLDKKWSSMIKHLSQHADNLRVLTCGPKGSGKSTFTKYLLNHILTASPSQSQNSDGVAFLDLDPGQPEFSSTGHIYLAHLKSPVLGPQFSHPSMRLQDGSVIRSHYIGSTSPKEDSDHYGLELLIWFVKSLGISDVVYMSETGPYEVVNPLQAATSQVGLPLLTLPSQPTEYTSRSSSQLRKMQMISYFHMQRPDVGVPIWSPSPISQARPITVSYAGSRQGILGVMVMGVCQDSEHLYELLDGALVGVVAVENQKAILPPGRPDPDPAQLEEKAEADDDEEEDAVDVADRESGTKMPCIFRTRKENLPFLVTGSGTSTPLDPEFSMSLGLGIVRCINTESQTLELITPIMPAVIRSALECGYQIVLVRGDLDNPDWAISEDYFVARSARKHFRKLKSRPPQENASNTRPQTGARMDHTTVLDKLQERARRAGNVPWLRVSDLNNSKEKQATNLWKLRKVANSAGSASGSERE